LLAILIGEKAQIENETLQAFRNSSLIHMLCVSGAHVTYVLLGFNFIASKLTSKKKIAHIFCIIGLCLFIGITGFSSSIARACIMGVLVLIAKIFLKQPDTINQICISLIVLIIINPFYLFDIGLLLSFGGTIGIVCFSKIGKKIIERITTKWENLKPFNKMLEILWVSISAQIIIMPITAYFFNTINITFIFSNLLATFLFSVIIYGGFIMLVTSYIFFPLGKLIAFILNFVLMLFKAIADFFSGLSFSNIIVTTPSLWLIARILFSIIYIFFI